MDKTLQQPCNLLEKPAQNHFNGAAIIDQDGREIPITEEMLQRAFAELQEQRPA